MRSHRRLRRAASHRRAGLAVAWLAVAAVGAGCGKPKAPAMGALAAMPERVVVRVGPLVAEHPLYPEVVRLTRRLEERPEVALGSAAEFMASPLGRVFAPLPEPPPTPGSALVDWESQANAALAGSLEEAGRLLASLPPPERPDTGVAAARRAEDELSQARSDAVMRVARAEMRAIEERRGELTEIRRHEASEDAQEAAQALDREVQLWREVEAKAEAAREQSDGEVRALEAEVEQRLRQSTSSMQAATEEQQRAHLGRLRESGESIRQEQRAAVAAATQRPPRAGPALDVPAAPPTGDFAALLRTVEREQRAAWDRRQGRLAAARSQLLERITQATRSAVRAVAAENGTSVAFSAGPGETLPDVTDSFRAALRSHWAGEAAVWGGEVAVSRP